MERRDQYQRDGVKPAKSDDLANAHYVECARSIDDGYIARLSCAAESNVISPQISPLHLEPEFETRKRYKPRFCLIPFPQNFDTPS